MQGIVRELPVKEPPHDVECLVRVLHCLLVANAQPGEALVNDQAKRTVKYDAEGLIDLQLADVALILLRFLFVALSAFLHCQSRCATESWAHL
jgi:hypothetical protein